MHRSVRVIGLCLAFVAPVLAAEPAAPLPDLITSSPFDLKIDLKSRPGGRLLRFANRTWNAGPGALVLRGEPVEGRSRVTQRIGSAERFVGYFVFHPSHKHWHFEDFSRYELWTLSPAGAPARRVAVSAKVGYCIWDEKRAPERVAGAAPGRKYPWSACRASRGTQGLSVGWSDTYAANLDGQFLDVSGLPDGRYALVSLTDPSNVIKEASDANNVAVRLLSLKGNKVTAERGFTRLPDGMAIAPQAPARPAVAAPKPTPPTPSLPVVATQPVAAAPAPAPEAAAAPVQAPEPVASAAPFRVLSEAPLAGLTWPASVQGEGASLTVAADPALAWTLASGEDAALPAPGDLALRFQAELSGDGSPAGSLLLYGERPAGASQRSFLQFSLAGEGRWRAQFLDGASGSVTSLLEFRTVGEVEVRLTGVAGPGAERLEVLAAGEVVGAASLPSRLLAAEAEGRSLRLGFQVSRGSRLSLSDVVLLGR